MSKINIESYYENLVNIRSYNYEEIVSSLEIVKQFIIDRKLILVGGMAIDLALKLKGDRIYSDDQLPDYDFYSPQHVDDAYKLSEILCTKGFKNVSCIQAMHITTMRVRVNFETVADITYCPKSIFVKIPTLQYHDLKIVHPHYQMIDQHNALSIPFENPGREVIFHRWKKDMKRYDKLYKYYPVVPTLEEKQDTGTSLKVKKYYTSDIISNRILNPIRAELSNQTLGGYTRTPEREANAYLELKLEHIELKFESIKNGCVCGWGAVGYEIDEKKDSIIMKIPKEEYISIASYDYKTFVKDNAYEIKHYYSEYFGQLPRYITCETQFRDSARNNKILQIFDTYGMLIGAKKISDKYNVFVCNIQWAMSYLLNRVSQQITPEISFTAEERYVYCRDLVKNGNKPTIEVYGTDNFTPAYVNMIKRNTEIIYNIKAEQVHPPSIYPKPPDCSYNKSFDPEKSEYFMIDGRQLKSFMPVNLNPYPEYTTTSVKPRI